MMRAVPGTPAELTPAWLTASLAGAPGFSGIRVTALSRQVIGEGFGLDGTVVRLGLETSPAPPPIPLVAKLARAKPGRIETDFYRRLAPLMPIRLPRLLASAVDAEGDRAVLLLEDIGPAEQGDILKGVTREQAEAVVRSMARFHRAFAGHDVLEDLPPWESQRARLVEIVRARTPLFLERYGASLPPRGLELVASLPDALPEIEAELLAAPRTLLHGDLHVENVIFPPRGEPVILDWTGACSGPAAADLSHLLVEGPTPAERARFAEDLIDLHVAVAGGDRGRLAREVRLAYVTHAARALGWGGKEHPGVDHPRVPPLVDAVVRNAFAAALDAP
jgi:hypothetical protein